ncbi:GNAT family N-acetyltransferase [Mariniluteicoccus flavus]
MSTLVERAERVEALAHLPHAGRPLPVQRATADDVPAIVSLLRDDVLGATREGADAAAYASAFDAIDRDPNQTLAVVRDGDAVVATLQLTLIPGLSRGGALRAQIEAVRVAASHRGGGLGSNLLAWAEAYAGSRGATMAQLTTDASRADGHRFYEREGWTASHIGMKKSLP